MALTDTGPSCLAADAPHCRVSGSAAAASCSGSSAADLASQFGNLKNIQKHGDMRTSAATRETNPVKRLLSTDETKSPRQSRNHITHTTQTVFSE